MRGLLTCLFILLELFIAPGWSQTPAIEKQRKIVAESKGIDKINALSDLSKEFCSVDPHKGIQYGQEAVKLAETLKIPSAKSKAFNSIGVNYWALSDYKTARSWYSKSLKNALLFKDSAQIALFYNRMGLIYESTGDFDSALIVFGKELILNRMLKNDERTGTALENLGTIHMNRGEKKSAITFFLEAKTLYENRDTKNKLPYIYLKLGWLYSEMKDYEIAGKWFRKGIDASLEIKDFQKAGMGLNGIGIILQNQGKYDEAIAKFQEALDMVKSINSKNLVLSIYGNLGNVFTSQGRYQEAIAYYQKSRELALQLKLPMAVAREEVSIGKACFGMKQYARARQWYETALPVFIAGKAQSNLLITYNDLIEVNNMLKNYEESVKYYQLSDRLKDSLNKKELNTALDSLKIRFNTEQTDRENKLLLEKTEIQNKTISLQKTIMISSFMVLLLLIILAVVIVRSRNRVKKANDLLALKNEEISAKAGELRMINKKLEELSKFKDSMQSFLVHDLKNPLNTIINIEEGSLSEPQTGMIRQSGRQMLNLVLNLLDIGKYENKVMKIAVTAVSLTRIINKAYSDVKFLAAQKSIVLKITYLSDVIIIADPDIIERVFVNLFTNAIKYSAPGGTITLSAEPREQGMLQVIVQDQGTGIDKEALPYIFEMFAPVAGKRSGYSYSTGIGLAFCKMAVEAHAGKIGVDSLQGNGSSFWFTLSLAESQEGLQPIPQSFSTGLGKLPELSFSYEEKILLFPHCDKLKKAGIHQISDVKDIIRSIQTGSENIDSWKSMLLVALSDCNEKKFHYLINIS